MLAPACRTLALFWLFGAVSAVPQLPRSQARRAPPPEARSSDEHARRATAQFSSPKASQFLVNGKGIPDVNFDVGSSWSGLLPISSDPHETRKLFFWYFPASPQGSADDLIFWTNGGPGCSSLEGLLQENGPFSWQFGQAAPTKNPYSWTNLANVLWIEQPVGTGFSQGTPNVTNENELAAQLVGFLQQFLNVFSELKGKKLYLTGESYGGLYVPYIADYIYSNPSSLALNLQGIWLGSPILAEDAVQLEAPAVNFVQKYTNVFAFNQSFLASLNARAQSCNYANYLTTHLTYPPPPAPFALPGQSVEFDPGCDVWNDIVGAALLLNPAFNIYRIFDMPPILWDVLGFPGTFPQTQSPIYFNRADVKAAIHAPSSAQWTECNSDVFAGSAGDTSPLATFDVLPRVIEKSARTVIVAGMADFVLIAEGKIDVAAPYSMTWNGKQGFQNAPQPDSLIIDGVGAAGTLQSERGLTYYEVAITGHMIPQFNPKAAFQSMQFLLGQRSSP
ncbi:alpha/beta-hydrolase [Artomyces pyxidatus]|uniref:Alpha/beta-hydrolase n=1 Tax=Artomyces pyxidatus TaxID=48021 RepID=A0ACB8SJA8_9AGAM|nr:alpha/beta-hydrolase [Artomyces pyxidatus]